MYPLSLFVEGVYISSRTSTADNHGLFAFGVARCLHIQFDRSFPASWCHGVLLLFLSALALMTSWSTSAMDMVMGCVHSCLTWLIHCQCCLSPPVLFFDTSLFGGMHDLI